MYYAIAYVLFCGACSVLAFARHPIYGLYFYLATTYVYPPARWWGAMVPDLRWAMTSAVVTVLAVWLHRGRLASKPIWLSNAPAVLLTLYASWMWLQSPWALDWDTHLGGTVQLTKYLVAFWFVYRLVDTKETLRDFMLAHTLGCALLGVFAQFTGRQDGRLDGVGGPGLDDANTLGMYLTTGAIVGLGLVLTQRGWRRWVSLGALPIILNGFILANSRGAFLGLVAGGLVLMVCRAREHRRLFWAFAVVGLIGLSVIVDKAFVERMFTIGDVAETDESADMSARSRREIVMAQLRMAADYPMGVGFRGTAVLSPRYLDRKWLTAEDGPNGEPAERSSHNTFMTTLVEQGVPGAFMFVCSLLWIIRAMFRVRRMQGSGGDPELATLAATLCAGLAVVGVAGLSTDYLMAEVQFWLFAALVSALRMGEAAQPAENVAGSALVPGGLRVAKQ